MPLSANAQPPPCVPHWVPVTDGLPPVERDLTGRSRRLLVATDEVEDGVTFAYCFLEADDGPTWYTACASGFDLHRVTHYALPPQRPAAAGTG